jgi:hypothetical protein
MSKRRHSETLDYASSRILEHRQEAERLALLPAEVQRQFIAEHRAVAANPRIPKWDRDLARERAEALQRLLFPPQRAQRARAKRGQEKA